VDWTIVVTTAITGAVGVAGVLGGVITSSKSAQRNITAEADRTRLADKRRIYARALETLGAAALAEEDERTVEGSVRAAEVLAGPPVEDVRAKLEDSRANANATRRAANEAVAELKLIAESPATVKLAQDALDSVSDRAAYDRHANDLLEALRADLGEEAARAYKPS
jgi:hypothetical protein